MPKDTYDIIKDRLEFNAGVLCPNGDKLEAVKKARRCDRKKPLAEILLMMFRSANRDLYAVH